MKKIISLFAVLCLVLGMVATMAVSVSAANATLTITSVDDWMNLLSGKTVTDKDIKVTADVLDFTGKTLVPVQKFRGTFDGQGVVIKNANVVTTGETGLFNCLEGEATFKNFAVTDSTFQGKEWVGTVVCCTNGNATLENIYVSDTVKVIAAKNGNNSYAGGFIGGCAGKADNISISISNCVFAGTVTAEGQYVGGFIGNAYNAVNVTIANSMMLGKVPADRNSSRGFIGNAAEDEDTITMTNCIYAGGSAGVDYKDHPFFNYFATANVTNCYTISTKADGSVYNSVKYTDENSGVSLVGLMDLVGTNASVTVDGFTKRENDIMLPTALVNEIGSGIPSTAEKYLAKYIVTWMNGDTVLDTEEYEMGQTPTYKGETPTMAEDDTYTYTFDKWSPEIVAVTGDVIYKAEFFKTRKGVEAEEETDETEAPETKAPETTASETTAPAEEEGGCGSVIGTGAVALVAMIGASVAFVAKKKED